MLDNVFVKRKDNFMSDYFYYQLYILKRYDGLRDILFQVDNGFLCVNLTSKFFIRMLS